MKCSKCGVEVAAGVTFCTNCGNNVTQGSNIQQPVVGIPQEQNNNQQNIIPTMESSQVNVAPIESTTPTVQLPIDNKMGPVNSQSTNSAPKKIIS